MKDQLPIWQWTASDVALATSNGSLSATEATKAAIARMEAANPALKAVVESLADEARAEAAALDRSTAPKGPLHGVPVTIKINVDQKGHATSNGVTAFKDVIAPEDAPVVRNLKAAGAVVIGRTNTPEFSFRADTDNPLFGRTHNPWGPHISAGGSSGGAGAAVSWRGSVRSRMAMTSAARFDFRHLQTGLSQLNLAWGAFRLSIRARSQNGACWHNPCPCKA